MIQNQYQSKDNQLKWLNRQNGQRQMYQQVVVLRKFHHVSKIFFLIHKLVFKKKKEKY